MAFSKHINTKLKGCNNIEKEGMNEISKNLIENNALNILDMCIFLRKNR